MKPPVLLFRVSAFRAATVAGVLLIITAAWTATAPASDPLPLTYERDVRPIFKAMCFHCHGEEPELQGGLDVRLVRLLQAGGDSGAAILAGSADDSLLWQRIETDEMPVGDHKLSDGQKTTIRNWINQGAPTARAEPDDPNAARFSEEELQFWAFHPPVKPPVPLHTTALPPHPAPQSAALGGNAGLGDGDGDDNSSGDGVGGWADSPIDAFILRDLAAHGLTFSPPADRATLLRRLKFDLHGLPPTSQELDDFLADQRPDAYQRLVDRLLDSPQYGVRWGRHWLDAAGYAESDGNTGTDRVRPHAWRYRDWVIDAVNADMPYDQFIREQLAGDELIVGQPDPENSQHVALLAATGFLRMAPDVTATDNTIPDRNQAVADAMNVVGSAVLGLSVGCAQCHDHRYDPISIDDYYRFRAIFDPAMPIHDWKQPDQRLVDMTPADVRQVRDEMEAIAVERDQDIERRRREVAQQIFDLRIAEVPEELQDDLVQAVQTPVDQQSDQQKQWLIDYPMVKSINAILAQFIEFDKVFQMKNYRQFEQEKQQVAAYRATKPLLRLVMTLQENPQDVPHSTVMFRGDPEQPTTVVTPGEIFVLARHRTDADFPLTAPVHSDAPHPPDDQSKPDTPAASDALAQPTAQDEPAPRRTTGRRLWYARQLTDGTHPTVARVAVNRIWHHHFGKGLVGTPHDLGTAGDRPTHPELLDYLAVDFVENGWQMKRLHQAIVLSRTYRQQSARTERLQQIDPDNQLYGRFTLRRMDAETIRDAMLFAAESLVLNLGGPSTPVTDNGEGQITLGKRTAVEGMAAQLDDGGTARFRRSTFIQVRRSQPLSFLEAFDMPFMNPNCDFRRQTTVAPQSLLLLNNAQILENSQRLARSILQFSDSPAQQIDQLFVRLFAQPATETEVEHCLQFVHSQRQRFTESLQAAKPDADVTEEASLQAMASLCQTLFASNRFLYID